MKTSSRSVAKRNNATKKNKMKLSPPEFVPGQMLFTGTSTVPSATGEHVNDRANAGGIFREVQSKQEFEKLVEQSANRLIANFPKS
jgi:hypothetical protein